MAEREPLIPKHGGYRKLKSFQIAQLVYDVTVRFCDRYIDKRSRTNDQMIQGARSGVQNIAEGSKASGTSKKTELRLTSVARSSLEELRLDYEDFLRQRTLTLWNREDPRRAELVAQRCTTADEVALWVKEICQGDKQRAMKSPDHLGGEREQAGSFREGKRTNQPSKSIKSIKFTKSIGSMRSIPSLEPTSLEYAEVSANAALVLIGVAISLLERQIDAQSEAFEKEGGFSERLYRIRDGRRRRK